MTETYELGRKLGELTTTFIIPMILGLWIGYKLLNRKKETKEIEEGKNKEEGDFVYKWFHKKFRQ